MKIFELVLAGVFGLLGVGALVRWVGRPFEGTDVRDHLLYAVFVTGRVGLCWSMAGFFVLSATLRDPNGTGAYVQGRAFTDLFVQRYGWYAFVVLGCAVLQLLAGFFLGLRRPGDEGRSDVAP